jgi:hypothetical protein
LTAIVLGPKTRLASALLSTTPLTRDRRLLIARTPAERDDLQARWPGCTILHGEELARGFVPPGERVVVFICALGPIHPDDGPPQAIHDQADQDLQTIARILRGVKDQPVHVVFVSTVLAITRPRPNRTWYAGWKLRMEAELQRLVTTCADGQLSVVYPGRLVTRTDLRMPATLLATSYTKAARIIARIGTEHRGVRRILGIDARLLIGLRGARPSVDAGIP